MSDSLMIYKNPYLTFKNATLYLESVCNPFSLPPLQMERVKLTRLRSGLLLDIFDTSIEDVADLYDVFQKEGSDQDKFLIRAFISDLFRFLGSIESAYEWVDEIEADKKLGLTAEHVSRLQLRNSRVYLEYEQFHLAYKCVCTGQEHAIQSESKVLMVLSILQLASINRAIGEYYIARYYLYQALDLTHTHHLNWLETVTTIALCEIEDILDHDAKALELLSTAENACLDMVYPVGYIHICLKKMDWLAQNHPDKFQTWIKEVRLNIRQLKCLDRDKAKIFSKALQKYGSLLNNRTRSNMGKILSRLRDQTDICIKTRSQMADALDRITQLMMKDYKLMQEVNSSSKNSNSSNELKQTSFNKHIDTVSHEIKNAVSVLKMSMAAIQDGHTHMTKHIMDTMLYKIESIESIVKKLDVDDSLKPCTEINIKYDDIAPCGHIVNYCEAAYLGLGDRVQILKNTDLDSIKLAVSLPIITQVLDNLISNAIKYSDDKTPIVITYSLSGNYIHFSVADQGCGISKEDSDKVFNAYYRSHTLNKDGKGIGLNYCKQIIENLGGNINVQSILNVGSTFTFTVPISLEPDQLSARLSIR